MEFNEAEIGENFRIIEKDWGRHFILDNKNVRIRLTYFDGKACLTRQNMTPLFLEVFQNKLGVSGIRKCSLLWLLNYLLDHNYIFENQVLKYDDDPEHANVIALDNMGFDLREPEPGRPVNICSTVGFVKQKLSNQCVFTEVCATGNSLPSSSLKLGSSLKF